MMDENSKLSDPLPARDVMMEAMVVSAVDNAAAAERYGGFVAIRSSFRPRFRGFGIWWMFTPSWLGVAIMRFTLG